MARSNKEGTFLNGNANLHIPRDKLRRISSGQSPTGRKPNLGDVSNEDDGGSGMHSLAHELAVALMPEPSANSRMLSEEFGIEFDEGAEGIDDAPEDALCEDTDSLANELRERDDRSAAVDVQDDDPRFTGSLDLTSHFGSASPSTRRKTSTEPQYNEDPMERLSRDLESTDKLLSQLRHIDVDAGHHSFSQPSIESYASDVIRHINDAARDREGQVRELLECEREFRKIAGEINGNDVLSGLDALNRVEGLGDDESDTLKNPKHGRDATSDTHVGERSHQRASSLDWETNPDTLVDEDGSDEEGDPTTPMKDSFLTSPPISGPATVPKILPQFIHVRSLTSSLATSLTAMSEHAQVNGAATADAGRKIRALKNKLGGWRSDWDSAERSRAKIERWEAGLQDDESNSNTLGSPSRVAAGRRIDSRRLVEEHLKAFESALADAGIKTQAIMARS